MPDKATRILLENLSLQVYNDKNGWKKLVNKGVPTLSQHGNMTIKRFIPLTEKQAKDFMVKKIELAATKESEKDV